MTYKFSFAKVLDFKEKEKEIAEQEFGTTKLRQLELEEQMDGLEQEKQKAFHQYNHVHRKTIFEILEVQQEIDHLNRQMKRLVHQSVKIHQEVEQKHQVLIEKSQEAKIWNQWNAKSKEAFQKQQDQKEQAMLDEMAVLRYTRKA